jgi:DNA-binding transcriptional ArsR family regulator
MSTPTAEILLHPIRLRIVLALGTERLTTGQISERLPDIAHATLYRHVALLAEAGLLEVVDEHRVRGGVERTYTAVREAVQLGPEDAAEMSADELLRGFVVFAGSLIDTFGRYVEDPRARPGEDLVGYRQAALWLDDSERAELVSRLRWAIKPYLEKAPSSERKRVLLSTILVPDLGPRQGD